MSTTYPNSIDGYSQIAVLRDFIDEIKAQDCNNLRSAIIAIEQTLGTNPQEQFGTVGARIGDVSNNIESHLSGGAFRHTDTSIDSALKTGINNNLLIGSTGSQLQGLLNITDDLKDTINSVESDLIETINSVESDLIETINSVESDLSDEITAVNNNLSAQIDALGGGITSTVFYGGSGVRDFADGYSLPASYISSAISEIVGQVGRSTGATKIGQAAFTSRNCSFGGSSINDNMLDMVGYLDDTIDSFRRIFDGFVIDGMLVSQSGGGPNAVIAPGHIFSNGRLLKYEGETLTISLTGLNIVYARFLGSSVSIYSSSTLIIDMVPLNEIVLLCSFSTSGGAWSDYVDLRRFGALSNNKPYFTVGNTPASGIDGYGCDFESLKSAINYVNTIDVYSSQIIVPKKIVLSGDISITTSGEANIGIWTEGLEVDGNNAQIRISVDSPVFNIEANYVHIHNIRVDYYLSSSPSSSCLAEVATNWSPTVQLWGIRINNCILTESGSYAPNYFIKCGRNSLSDENTVRNSIISNNIADVLTAGISFSNVTTITSYILYDSFITNNRFHRTTSGTTLQPCIKANNGCVISGNHIYGGFQSGIVLDNGQKSSVIGNIIMGEVGLLITNGILVRNAASTTMDTVISDNSITKISDFGVKISGECTEVIIHNNIIDNSSLAPPPDTMTGILGFGIDEVVANNRILAPGNYGVDQAKYVLNNHIIGSLDITDSNAGIRSSYGASNRVYSGNVIENFAGTGIDINSSTNSIITNNNLHGCVSSGNGIINVGENSTISNNTINSYGQVSGSIITTALVGKNVLISSNRIIYPYMNTNYIIYLYDGYTNIINNMIGDITYGIPQVGFAINNEENCIISGNTLYGAFTGATLRDAIAKIGNNCIVKNNIIQDSNYDSIVIEGNNVLCSSNIITGAYRYSIVCDGFDRVLISENVIKNSGDDAIEVLSSEYTIISENKITDSSGHGIQVGATSPYAFVYGNYVEDLAVNKNAINLNESNYPSIIGNYGANLASVVAITNGTTDALILNNYSVNNTYGISYGLGGVINGLISGNTLVSGAGIAVNGANVQIIGNFIHSGDSSGIVLSPQSENTLIAENHIDGTSSSMTAMAIASRCHNSLIINNKLCDIGFNGIKLFTTLDNGGSDGVIIRGNYLDTVNGQGITLVGDCNYCVIDGNYLRNINKEQIAVYANVEGGSKFNTITNNYIYGDVESSRPSGFSILVSGLSSPKDNRSTLISGNYIIDKYAVAGSSTGGIWLDEASESIVSNNFLYGTDGCIRIDSSSWSSITGNTVYGPLSGSAGIITSADCVKMIVTNNFISLGYFLSTSGIIISGGESHNISGNTIRFPGPGFIGIVLNGVSKSIVNNNFVCDFDGTYAFDFSVSDGCLFNGNYCNLPGGSSNGMNLTSCTDCLVVGNYCFGGTGSGIKGFIIDAIPSIVASGNFSRGNTSPGGWGVSYTIDSGNCIYIA